MAEAETAEPEPVLTLTRRHTLGLPAHRGGSAGSLPCRVFRGAIAMVPPEMRQQPHVSFTQIDQYLRCPLKYKFTYVDRLEPEFVPAALAFGSGIHGAAAFLLRGRAEGTPPGLADVQAFFEGYWKLE